MPFLLLMLTVTSPFDHYKSGLETPAWHSDSVPLAIGRWPDAARQVACGVDQSDVGERLREIAHQASRPGVVFLCQEANVVAQFQQALEEPEGVVVPA